MLGLYEKALPFSLDWDTKLGAVKELGFDFMELSIDPAHMDRLDWTESGIAELRDASLRTGLPIYTIALSANREFPMGSKDEGTREKGKSVLKKAIRLARKLGVRIVQVATYDVFDEESDAETDRLYLDGLRECERVAALAGVMLALETMDTPYADSIGRCKRILDIIGSPWIQIYADIGNIAAMGLDFTKEIDHGASHVIAVHLKDTMPGVVRRIDYGTGIVDFDTDLKKLFQLDFRGFFVAEMWGDDIPDYMEKAAGACRFLREKIAAACV